MTKPECLIVSASELRPGDRLRLPGPYAPTQWRVLDPPVKIILTGDVNVHLGIRERDPGISVRMAGHEQVVVLRPNGKNPRT